MHGLDVSFINRTTLLKKGKKKHYQVGGDLRLYDPHVCKEWRGKKANKLHN